MIRLLGLLLCALPLAAEIETRGHVDLQADAFPIRPEGKHKNDFTLLGNLEAHYTHEAFRGVLQAFALSILTHKLQYLRIMFRHGPDSLLVPPFDSVVSSVAVFSQTIIYKFHSTKKRIIHKYLLILN